jgi:hypothetical protein
MTYYAMADSRTITDYRPSRDINLELMKKFDIKDYNKYRFFMQKNGNQVLDYINKKPCPVCKKA